MDNQRSRSWTEDIVEAARAGTGALFDPEATGELLDDVAREAMRGIAEARERFAGFLDGAPRPQSDGGNPASSDVFSREQRASFERAVDAFSDWFRVSAETAFQLAEPFVRSLTQSQGLGGIDFPPTVAGTTATTTFPLGADDTEAVEDVLFHCDDLRSSDELIIPASRITFDPPKVDRIDAGTTHHISVQVDVPEATPPGKYRGVIMATQFPDTHFPILLEVVPRVSG